MASSLVAEERDQEEAWLYSNVRYARGKTAAHTSAAERLCSATSFDLLPFARSQERRRRDSATTAEGPPHVRGGRGTLGVSRRPTEAQRRTPRRGWRARGGAEGEQEH